MLDRVVAAGLQDIQESFKVTMKIGIGIGYGISDPSLGRQVDHHVELLLPEQFIYQ